MFARNRQKHAEETANKHQRNVQETHLTTSRTIRAKVASFASTKLHTLKQVMLCSEMLRRSAIASPNRKMEEVLPSLSALHQAVIIPLPNPVLGARLSTALNIITS